MSSSPLLLFKSGSLRRRTTTDAAGIGLPDEGNSAIPQPEPPHRLRRVFTTHACRRSGRSARQQEVKTAGHASPLQWRMTAFMKKPLGIANSVPLGVPLNFNRSAGIVLTISSGIFSISSCMAWLSIERESGLSLRK